VWAFFFVCSCHRFNTLSGLGLGTDLQRIHNGITTDSALRKLEKLLHLEGARVEELGGLFKCKVSTFFANVPTNHGKLYDCFEEKAFCAYNTLIYK
jgi:hypothetical protein